MGDASLLRAAPITIDLLPASGLLVFPGALQTIRKRSVPIVDFISIDLSPMRFQWVNIDPSRYTVTSSGSGNCVTRQLVSFPLSAEVAAIGCYMKLTCRLIVMCFTDAQTGEIDPFYRRKMELRCITTIVDLAPRTGFAYFTENH